MALSDSPFRVASGFWALPNLPQLDLSKLTFNAFLPGIDRADLVSDAATGHATSLLRYAAGASVGLHRHTGYEHIWVLQGEQTDDDGTYPAGTLMIRAPGTSHRVWSKSGCLVLAVWERPVEFL